jgi:hypothetical protein
MRTIQHKDKTMAKPKTKLSWIDKLNASKPPVVKPAPMNFAGMLKGQMMLIPSPKLLDTFIRSLPEGKAMDMTTMRTAMAKQNRAVVSCPVTTGIVLRTVVEAANEAHAKGVAADMITPVWRVVDAKAAVLKKVSFDPAWLIDQRMREGI